MKIAVLGGSTSIMGKGYFPIYQALEYPNQVDNFSNGGVSSIYGQLVLLKNKLSDYDVIITQYSAGDTAMYENKHLSLTDIYISDLFYNIAKLGKIHINLALGRRETVKTCEVFKIYRECCKKYNAYNIEAHIILDIIEKNKDKLWIDHVHMQPFFAQILAHIIKEKRIILTRNKVKNKLMWLTQFFKKNICYNEYFYLNLATKKNTMVRGTSLKTENVYLFNQKEKITCKPNSILRAVMLNSVVYNSSIYVSNGKDVCRYNIISKAKGFCFYFPSKDKTCQSINNELLVVNGIIKQNDNLEDDFIYNKYCNELCGFLFEKKIYQATMKLAPHYQVKYQADLRRYQKVYSFVTSCLNEMCYDTIKQCNDIDMLYIVSSLSEDEDYSLFILEKICALTKYSNPYFLARYLALSINKEKMIPNEIILKCEEYNQLQLVIQLVLYYKKNQNYEKSLDLLNKWINNNTFHLLALYHKALILIILKQYKEAVENLLICCNCDIENLGYRRELLRCYSKMNKMGLFNDLMQELKELYMISKEKKRVNNFKVLKEIIETINENDFTIEVLEFVKLLKENDYEIS